MVEGGAQVISGFLAGNLVDQVVITIAPQIVGGLTAVQPFTAAMKPADRGRLGNVQYESLAGDLVVYADVEKPASKQARTRPQVEAPLSLSAVGPQAG